MMKNSPLKQRDAQDNYNAAILSRNKEGAVYWKAFIHVIADLRQVARLRLEVEGWKQSSD